MTPERRAEIESSVMAWGCDDSAACMLRELLDELDLRNEQIRITRELFGEIAGMAKQLSEQVELSRTRPNFL